MGGYITRNVGGWDIINHFTGYEDVASFFFHQGSNYHEAKPRKIVAVEGDNKLAIVQIVNMYFIIQKKTLFAAMQNFFYDKQLRVIRLRI